MKKKIKTNRITKDMTFIEIIKNNPEAFEILFRKGMHCIGCGMAGSETLEQGAMAHGINPDELVDELNRSFNKIPRRKTKLSHSDKKVEKKKTKKTNKSNKIKKTKKNIKKKRR